MMREAILDALRGATPITSRQHHDVGVDTRREANDSNLVLMLDGETYGPAWLVISTQPVYHHTEGKGRPVGAKNLDKRPR